MNAFDGLSASGMGLSGTTGQIQLGRKVVAALTSWSKGPARKAQGEKECTITFSLGHINDYWANYGPPTAVVLTLLKRRLTYQIKSGDFRAGALIVKLPPRVEKT